MATQVQVTNMALALLGQESITTMADSVRSARFASLFWDSIRDEVLRQHPWNFAIKRAVLSENYLLRSEAFDNASWTKTNVTATGDTVRAPDGNTTADTLNDASASAGTVAQTVSIPDNSDTYTLSVYLKQGTAAITTVVLALSGGSTADSETVNVTWAATPTIDSGSIEDVGDGWWRVSLTLANNATGHTSLVTTIYPSSSTAASQGTVYAWGAQITKTSSATGYSATTSAANRWFTPNYDFARGFAKPSDFIRLVKPEDETDPFKVEGSSILTNNESINFEYVYQHTDPATWDSQFVHVMAPRLAAELAMALSGDMGRFATMMKLYAWRLGEAQFTDAKENQQPSDTYESYSWLEARH